MKISSFAMLCFCLLLCNTSVSAAEADLIPVEGFLIPDGNVAAGRKAFIELKCTQCHLVADDEALPRPTSEIAAPTFNYIQSRYSIGWLMTAIVTPSHEISATRYIPPSHEQRPGSSLWVEKGEDSEMKYFADRMTVRQLIDIVAYLRSIKNV